MSPTLWTWRRPQTAAKYTTAVIPLDEAHEHSHSYRSRQQNSELAGQLDDGAFDEDETGGDKDDDQEEEDVGMFLGSSGVHEYSIEGLRREVRQGRRGEKRTAYENGALFLEFLPDASSSLLTLLSVWWPIGQLCSSLFAWYFIAHWPADQGWRYFIMTIGLITFTMFLIRVFLFDMLESPKYLLSRGRQAEAVAVVQGIAHKNNRKTWLTESILNAVVDDPSPPSRARLSTTGILKTRLNSFSASHLAPSSTPVPSLSPPPSSASLASPEVSSPSGPSHPSPLLGRRGTLALSTLLSAIFLFLFVALGTTPQAQLVFSCVEALAQNSMYGVLYAFTPEVFPAPVRGAGTGVASFLNRAMGLLAPVVAATVPGDGTRVPVLLAAGLILAAGGAVWGAD
ncbi:hypothetical protein N0V88_001024 [Collariella sp. IMI 366227]|nr:hypothetical protein N0V88_001024 [Collariella sp. IMI 366227]